MTIKCSKRESALGLLTGMEENGGFASPALATSYGAKANLRDSSGLDYAADAGWIEKTPSGVWQLTNNGRGVM